MNFNILKNNYLILLMYVIISFIVIFIYKKYGLIYSLFFLLSPFAIFLVIKNSVIFVILFILFSYFRIHEAFPVLMALKIPKLLALASILGVLWHLFLTKKIKPFWNNYHSVFFIYFIWITLCVLLATNRNLSMEYWSSTLTKIFIMFFIISWWINNKRAFDLTRIGIIISGILISCVAIFNKINGIGLVEVTRVTISRDLGSQIGDPNDLSLVLLFPISFLCAELINKRNHFFYRFILIIMFILVVYAIIATQSRGGLLGLLAIIAYFISKKIKNKMILISIIISILLLLLLFAGISERQSGGVAEQGIDESAMGRIYAWQAAINMAISNPFTGVGINNFYANYFFYSPHWDGKNHAVHSTWFQVLSETGFIGFSLFAILIATIYKILKKCEFYQKDFLNKEENINVESLKAGLIGFIVSGTFLTQAFTWPLYIIIALSIGLEQMLHSKLNKEKRGVK